MRVVIEGPAGGSRSWRAGLWRTAEASAEASAQDIEVRIIGDDLWRVAVRLISPGAARTRSHMHGDEDLAERRLQLVPIIR